MSDDAKVTITLELSESNAAAIFAATEKMKRGRNWAQPFGVSDVCMILAKEYCDRHASLGALSRGASAAEGTVSRVGLSGAVEGTLYGGDPATNGSTGAPQQ